MTNPLADAFLSAADPVVFARRVGIEPHAWQVPVLRSTGDRLLLLCSRQVGKSTMAALLALHRALHVPDSLVLITAPSMRQSSELFRKVQALYRVVDRLVEADSENTQSLSLANGSRIVSLPGSPENIRGFSSVALLLIDEAAFVLDELYTSVLPVLSASRGRMIAMSTPNGRRGWFYRAATSDPDWSVTRVTALESPLHSAAWLERHRAAMSDWEFRQEYQCEFMAGATSFFDPALIAALSDPDVLPLFGGGGAVRSMAPLVDLEPVTVVDEPVSAVDVRAQARQAAFEAVVGRGL